MRPAYDFSTRCKGPPTVLTDSCNNQPSTHPGTPTYWCQLHHSGATIILDLTGRSTTESVTRRSLTSRGDWKRRCPYARNCNRPDMNSWRLLRTRDYHQCQPRKKQLYVLTFCANTTAKCRCEDINSRLETAKSAVCRCWHRSGRFEDSPPSGIACQNRSNSVM